MEKSEKSYPDNLHKDIVLSNLVCLYYLLYALNIMIGLNCPWVNIPLGGNVFFIIFFLCVLLTFNYFFRYSYKYFVVLEILFLIMYAYSMISGYAEISIVVYYAIWTMLICIPLFCIVSAIEDTQILLDRLLNISPFIIVGSVVTLFINFGLDINSSKDYNLPLSTLCLLFIFIDSERLFYRFNYIRFFFEIVAVVANLLWGGRRVLLILGIYFIIKFIRSDQFRKWAVTLVFWLLPIIMLGIVFLFYKIKNNEGTVYTSIRIVDKLMSGELFSFSSRVGIYTDSIEIIKEHAIMGVGLCGGWKEKGLYPHNIVLEICQATGVIIGAFLCFLLIVLIVLATNKLTKHNDKLFCIYGSFFPILFLSGTILNDVNSWIFFAICMNIKDDIKYKGDIRYD